MKQLSWEKFNETPEEDEEDDPQAIHGMLMNTMGSIGPNANNYEDFNMFIGHTNFYITSEIVAFLCMVEGLEALDILTPYRFRIAIGKLFMTDEILNNIKAELTKEKNE